MKTDVNTGKSGSQCDLHFADCVVLKRRSVGILYSFCLT